MSVSYMEICMDFFRSNIVTLAVLQFYSQYYICTSVYTIPLRFSAINGWEFSVQILHTYYAFLSMLDYKFLFNYLQL